MGGQIIGKNCFAIASKTNKARASKLKEKPKSDTGEVDIKVVAKLAPVRETPPLDEAKIMLIASMMKQEKTFGQIRRATGLKPAQLKEVIRMFMVRL